jgi:hypothetical protein
MFSGEVGGTYVLCSFGAIMYKNPAVIPLSERAACMKQVLSKEFQSTHYTGNSHFMRICFARLNFNLISKFALFEFTL